MKWKELREAGAYLFVSLFSVGLAAYLSLQFLSPAQSQENQAPPPVESSAPQLPPQSAPPPAPEQVEEIINWDEPSEPQGSQGPQGPQIDEGIMAGESAAPEDLSPRPEFPVGGDSSTAATARELEVFLEPYIYDAGERKNPFQPYHDVAVDEDTPRSPLQKYALNELTLLGIMWDVKSPKAMFVDPMKTVHVVGRDEGIGLKNGYIAAIREGEVVIVEAERKETGIIYETKVLRLPR